jgi:membrane protease YdiL (CAAX protease family)
MGQSRASTVLLKLSMKRIGLLQLPFLGVKLDQGLREGQSLSRISPEIPDRARSAPGPTTLSPIPIAWFHDTGYTFPMFPYAPSLNMAGWNHLLFFGLILPVLAIRTWWKLIKKERPLPLRMKYLQSTAVMLLSFTSLSLLVALVERIHLFPYDTTRLGQGLLTALAMYIVAVILMRPCWRKAVVRRARIVYLLTPDTAAERTWWIVVSVLAGVGEEITWRGVQTALLIALTGSYWTGAVASAISFGVAHFVQGWKSASIVVIFSLGFAFIVWISGSLYFAMLTHAAYDITAGFMYARFGKELGYKTEMAATDQSRS